MYPVPFSGNAVYTAIFWTTYALWLALEFIASRTKRHREDPSRARDRGSLWLLVILFWVGNSLAFALSFLLQQATILGHRTAIFFLGIALMLAGMAFRRYAMSVLGRFFTFEVAIHSGHSLVEAGPYRYIRHPSYTGVFITQIGLGLALGNWASLAALLVCLGIGYVYRISVEEAALIAALGEPYQRYMRRTARLIPFVF